MQTEERAAQARAMQSAQEQAFTALCQHLEHAPDRQILSDHTAVLVFGTDFDRREEALRLIRGQLYSRNSRDTGRVESWFADCCARIQEDRDGFVQAAQDEYIREGLAEEERQLNAAKEAKKKRKFRIRPACEFAPETAEYLVEPYLPRGMVSILGGVSGAGKTSLALDICARLTRGETPPSRLRGSPPRGGGLLPCRREPPSVREAAPKVTERASPLTGSAPAPSSTSPPRTTPTRCCVPGPRPWGPT